MIRFLVIIAIFIALCYFGYTIVVAPHTNAGHSQQSGNVYQHRNGR